MNGWAALADVVTHQRPVGVTASLPGPVTHTGATPLVIPDRPGADGRLPATPKTATALPIVWACIEIIANTAVQIPLTTRQAGQRTALPEWLRRPELYNGWRATLPELVDHLVVSQALHGYGCLWADPVGTSADSGAWALQPVDPDRVTVSLERDGDGRPGQQRVWSLEGTQVPLARRWSTRANSPGLVVVPHRVLPAVAAPLGPVQAARVAVGGYLDTDGYGADVFGSGVPQGVLTTEQEITQGTADRYSDTWAAGARKPVRVLGNGFAFTPFRLSPKDAAWLEARRFNAEEVARLFSVPAYKLNLTQSGGLVYNNAENLDGDFLRSCVYGGYLRPIEQAFDRLTPPGRTATEEILTRFDFTALLQTTTVDRFDAYAKALAAGWLTVDEVRTREGLPPMPAARTQETPA